MIRAGSCAIGGDVKVVNRGLLVGNSAQQGPPNLAQDHCANTAYGEATPHRMLGRFRKVVSRKIGDVIGCPCFCIAGSCVY